MEYALWIKREASDASLQLEGHLLCAKVIVLLAVVSVCVHRIIRGIPEYDCFPF